MGTRAKDRAEAGGNDWLWRGAALLLGTVVLGLGCGPAKLAYLMMPWDPGEPAECALVPKDKKDKNLKIVVLVSYGGAPDISPELLSADQELSEKLSFLLRSRFEEQKIKAKLVPPHLVKAYQNKEEWRTQSMGEIGKHFQADRVVNLEINSMSLYEKNSRMIFKGNVDITITVTDMSKEGEEAEIFRKQYLCEYPKVKIIPADSGGGAQYFRSMFITRISKDLLNVFTSHPTDEDHRVDQDD